MKNKEDYQRLLTANVNDAESMLKNKEIDVDVTNEYHKTVLFSSSFEKSKMLIKYGANVNYKDYAGNTPLFTTLNNDKFTLLLNNGAEINITNDRNQSLIYQKSMIQDIGVSEYVKLLKKYNFDFLGDRKVLRLCDVNDLEMWKEIVNQNCIQEIPKFKFSDNEYNREHNPSLYNRNSLLFIQNFEMSPEIIEFLFNVCGNMFDFVISKYNYDIDFLKNNYNEEVHSVFDKEMVKLRIKNEKEKIMLSIKNGNVESPSSGKNKRL